MGETLSTIFLVKLTPSKAYIMEPAEAAEERTTPMLGRTLTPSHWHCGNT